MVAKVGISTWFGLFIALLCCNPSWAGLTEGLAARAKQDYATAVKEPRPLADRGNAEAQYRIGLMLEAGHGYSVDKAQAVAWFRKAADQSLAAAQFKLGAAFEHGAGVERDPVLAYVSYAIAAQRQSAVRHAARRHGVAVVRTAGAAGAGDDPRMGAGSADAEVVKPKDAP